VTIGMSATAFDAFVMLFDPSFIPVAHNDDRSSGTKDASLTFTLTSTGTWSVVTNSLEAGKSGDYYLSLTSSGCEAAGPRRRSVRH
jgi:hypothetical protein